MVNEDAAGATGTGATTAFIVSHVLLQSVSLDAPRVRRFLIEREKGEINHVECKVTSEPRHLRNDTYRLDLRVTVHGTVDGQDVFQATVEEVGIFRISGYTQDEAQAILRSKGADIVYPYASEVIHSLAGRCGIQRLRLRPLIPGAPQAGGE